MLNPKQQIGLQYFREINQKIPRSEIEKYKELFIKIFHFCLQRVPGQYYISAYICNEKKGK